MQIWELVLIAVGLSMDAFAVAICKGLKMPRLKWGQAACIALFFGGFQLLMPLLGYLVGQRFAGYITRYDHWIAFVLLAFIGGKMVVEALRGGEEEDGGPERFDLKELLALAIATSIDALAVGVTFSFLQVEIVSSVCLIGSITFALSLLGVWVGHRFGARFQKRAEIAGGVILILIGLKILLEHLGVL